jgi:hypothetical protein
MIQRTSMKHIFLLIALLALSACSAPQGENTGTMVVTVTDAAADMGSVTSIMVTIDSVMVHSEADGWTTVSSDAKTVDLLELKAQNANSLVALVNLSAGDYNQMRLDISDVVVTDAQGEHEAKLPSGELKVNTNFTIGNGTTTAASFDFIAHESLHVTGNGRYILAPVVQVETRDDVTVDASNEDKVLVAGGTVRTNARVGMDIKGNVGVDVRIPANAKLDIGGNSITVASDSALALNNTGAVGTGIALP